MGTSQSVFGVQADLAQPAPRRDWAKSKSIAADGIYSAPLAAIAM
ncbi:hypothetical protein [Neiella litorisoli]|nr:hypothetical protein [Neiella litorisoli]